MYVRAAAEHSLSGTPMHLLLEDAPNCAISRNGMFHARMEPLRAFISSYPMDGILRASEKYGCPINRILSDTTSAFTDQLRLCNRKHCSLQHHPCFWAMINLELRICRPWCCSSCATGTPVAPTADSKRNLATPYFLRSSDPSVNFCARSSTRICPFLLDFDLQETFFRRPPSRFFSFGRLQNRSFLDDFNTVWPSADLYHNPHIFSSGSFFVRSLQSYPDIVCYRSVLFSVPCSIFFCVYQFDPWMDHNSFLYVSM